MKLSSLINIALVRPFFFYLITIGSMLPTITDVGPFYLKFIREFIVNMSANLNDHGSPKYQNVHVRGKYFEISPALLN